MKKRFLPFIITISLLISAVFYACAPSIPQEPEQTVDLTSYEIKIKKLEEELIKLQQTQQFGDHENEKLIKELQEELKALRAETTAALETEKALPNSIFIYSISNGKAIIDGFTGDDEHIVIPAEIDGLEVYGISANAFEACKNQPSVPFRALWNA